MPGGRVLMIAHHFPPAGGSGSNRALAFARYLPENGWTPIVLTPGEQWAANRDRALLSEVPPGLRVIRTCSLEARSRSGQSGSANSASNMPPVRVSQGGSGNTGGRRYGQLRTHVGHLKRFPDAHIGWLPFALGSARHERYDVAYSTSGPFTSHVIGLFLKRLTRKPWVAELRDGWYRWNRAIFPDYPAWRNALERHLEAAVIRSADRVVLVTDRMADTFRKQYRDLAPAHFSVVPNGFDPAQLTAVDPEPHTGWRLLHAGALYYGRSLAGFLVAVRRLVDSDPAFARDFHLRLLGTFDANARAEVTHSGLDRFVNVESQVDHSKAIQAMRSSDALLLVANTTAGAEATVPGKLFEYLAIGRPVLAVAPKESATADVLLQAGSGWLAPADDVDAIACVLQRAYTERNRSFAPADVRRFDRRRLTAELARIFDEVAA
jgi:glycosyltransferase involved in cell wall biosynthesis